MGWTQDRLEILLRGQADGLSGVQIAAVLGGVSRQAVIAKLNRLGLSPQGGRGNGLAKAKANPVPSAALGFRSTFGPRDRALFSPDEDRAIVQAIAAGVAFRDIARRIGRQPGETMTRIEALRRKGLIQRPAKSGLSQQRLWQIRQQSRLAAPDKPLPQFRDGDAPAAAQDPEGRPITMCNVRDGQCRWPIGDVGTPGFHLCGQDAAGSYCAYHAGRAVQRVPPAEVVA